MKKRAEAKIKQPIRLLHFADIHFGMENYGRLDPKTGLHSRLGDFERSYQEIVDYALGKTGRGPERSRGVDLVIFAGDAFKTRDPSPTYVRAFAKGIRDMAGAGIPVVMVVGNHDLPNATGKAHTLDIFTALAVPNVVVSREPEHLTVKTKAGPLQVVTLPWMYKSQLFSRQEIATRSGEEISRLFQEKVIDLFRLAFSKVNLNVPAVGVVHASVEGAAYGSERAVILGSDIVVPLTLLANPKLRYVAVGHIHKHQVLSTDPPVIYSGSIERIDFGEEHEAKGFVVAELSNPTQFRFIATAARPFKTIHVEITESDVDPTAKVLEEVSRTILRGAVVRVVVACPESRAAEIRETAIRDALAGADFIAGIVKHVERGTRLREVKGFSDELLSASPLDALGEYFKKRQLSTSRVETLKETAKELLEQVEPV